MIVSFIQWYMYQIDRLGNIEIRNLKPIFSLLFFEHGYLIHYLRFQFPVYVYI